MNPFARRVLLEAGIDPSELNEPEQVNPYLINNPARVIKIVEKRQKNHYYVDMEDKGGIFVNEDLLTKLLPLNNMTKNVFFYLLTVLPKNSFIVNIDLNELKRVMEISMNTYYKTIKELCSIGLITKKKKSIYWINVHMIFKGNRPLSILERFGEQFIHVTRTVVKE